MLGRAAEAAGLYSRRFRSKLVVVAFHRVNDWMAADGITCRAAQFKEFCTFFKEHFRVVPLSEQRLIGPFPKFRRRHGRGWLGYCQ